MHTVTVSPKFQVVIPKVLRSQMGLLPGQKLQILQYGDRLELLPIRTVKEMRGFLKGIRTESIPESGKL